MKARRAKKSSGRTGPSSEIHLLSLEMDAEIMDRLKCLSRSEDSVVMAEEETNVFLMSREESFNENSSKEKIK